MPFALIVFGVVLFMAAVRDKVTLLGETLKDDFGSGPNNPGFLAWVGAIVLLGLLGSIKRVRPVADAFLALLMVVLLLVNGGLFSKLQEQLMRAPGNPSKANGNE